MRRIMVGLVLALLLPGLVQAQSKKRGTHVYVTTSKSDCCWGNRWSFEPYAGAFDDPYDISPDGDETGYLVGLRIGYMVGSRTRLGGNVGYSSVDNVGDPQGLSGYYVYDNTWVFTTAGGEFDVVPGRTSASIGLQAGAAWRRVDLDGQVGTPIGNPDGDSGFSGGEVLIPAVLLRHRLSSRATLTAGLHDHIFDFLEGTAKHGIGITAGVAFR